MFSSPTSPTAQNGTHLRRPRFSEHLLGNAERLAGLGCWEYEPSDGRLNWSETMYSIFGLPPRGERPSLKTFLDLAHPEDREEVKQALRQGLRDNQPFAWEERLVRCDGSMGYMRCRGDVLNAVDGHARCLVGVCQDITEMKHLEEQLLHLERMHTMGGLVAAVTHDFNNLLTIILGMSELLLHNRESGMLDGLRLIHQSAERGQGLTQRLLTYSRKQSLSPSVVDLGELVRHSEKLMAMVAGKCVEVKVDVKPGPLWVRVDSGGMEQALLNLAANARDALSQGGNLRLEVSPLSSSNEFGDGPWVVLRCSDDGCGMDEATRSRAFDVFFTTKPPGKGTGLGLTQVRAIAWQSGGQINLLSEPQKGTTVEILLPMAGPPNQG